MKKQIITVASVALAVILLFVAYSVFLKDDGIEEVGDPFYTLDPDVASALAEVEAEAVIELVGYDSADDHWVTIQRFADAIAAENSGFSITTSSGGDFTGVRISVGSAVKDIAFGDFFKTLYDGTPYAFDGEALIANAVFSLVGKTEMDISLRALSGYDIDGDTVNANGIPYIFPTLNRSDIAYLTINNSHGEYSILQVDGNFYFDASDAIEYDDEAFSLLTTNCRYPVTYGKMYLPEGQEWKNYGLDDENPSTGRYTIITEPEKDGSYALHTVYIGDLASSGSFYYARYIGGVFEPDESSGTEDEMIHNLSKDIIYFLPVSAVDESIGLPQTDMMKPILIEPITGTEEIYTIDNIRIEYLKEGLSAYAKNLSAFNPADNIALIDSSSLSHVIADKKFSDKDYSSYSGGWRENIDVFGGFSSSDRNATYIEAALTRKAPEGNYRVVLGLLRDEAGGAYLPNKITLQISYDGVNWHALENGIINPSHRDGEVGQYELSFNDKNNIKYIRFVFDVPQIEQTYVVFDEIMIYADGKDAQPEDSIGGAWKLIAPADYVSKDLNFAHLDITNFTNFVQYLACIEGERVVACGFADNGNAEPTLLNKDILAEYGLADPDIHYSFEYDGVICDFYISAPTEDGKYYAYATYTGEMEGKTVVASSDVIVELTTDTAPWLAWDFVEFLDHSLFSIYLVDISNIEISFDGNDYSFDLSLDENGQIGDISYLGKSYNVDEFKYLYRSMLSIYMQDEYIPADGETPIEYLRFKISSESNSPEIVFYRVSASKCYFTIDGEGSYYALVEEVRKVRDNVLAYVSGGTIPR